jgi:hypothetical protein
MRLREISSWSRRSLLNQIVLSEAVVAAPFFFVFCVANYREGTLTFGSALRILVVAMSVGIVAALSTWFIFVAPRVRRREDARPEQSRKSSNKK